MSLSACLKDLYIRLGNGVLHLGLLATLFLELLMKGIPLPSLKDKMFLDFFKKRLLFCFHFFINLAFVNTGIALNSALEFFLIAYFGGVLHVIILRHSNVSTHHILQECRKMPDYYKLYLDFLSVLLLYNKILSPTTPWRPTKFSDVEKLQTNTNCFVVQLDMGIL